MFSELIARNSKRNRKENGLFFSSMLVAIVAFYIILSLPEQDVMRTLTRMESDAVTKLLTMIPLFFAMTLLILAFLIYYAGKYQLERRKHEFGVYLMLGMRRSRLFFLLLAEDMRNSGYSLLVGLPIAVLAAELISLISAKAAGLGLSSHHSSFSIAAILITVAAFTLIKLLAFLVLATQISRQEIDSLLHETPEGAKRQLPAAVYAAALGVGAVSLIAALSLAIQGSAWTGLAQMGIAMLLGFGGSLLLFYGLRLPIGWIARRSSGTRVLHTFTFRQLQETVICRSGTLAVCYLLIFAAMCFFGAGLGISLTSNQSQQHVLDYTFPVDTESGGSAEEVVQALEDAGLEGSFSALFQMKDGHVHTGDNPDQTLQADAILATLEEQPASDARDTLTDWFIYDAYPYVISLSGYNQLLTLAGLPSLTLTDGQAAVYMDSDYNAAETISLMNQLLAQEPECVLGGKDIHLTGTVQTTNLVTDRSVTHSLALIVTDEAFEAYTQGRCNVYLNGVLNSSLTGDSLFSGLMEMNEKLDETGLDYESYLQNWGRQLFYTVAASYITLYLAIIFLIVANTMIGVQFLVGQQKSGRRYWVLSRLGAGHPALCQSLRRQINWYFGIPVGLGALTSLFGVKGLLSGILSSFAKLRENEIILLSACMILLLFVVECVYMTAVKRTSAHNLLALTEYKREE